MKKFYRWIPAVVWMIIIFFLSGRESMQVAQNYWYNFLFFKTLHIVEYGILFTLYIRALGQVSANNKEINVYTVAFILTLLYAITDEIHQTFVPTREGKLRDVIIDGLGAGLAWIIIVRYIPKTPKKLKALAETWLHRV